MLYFVRKEFVLLKHSLLVLFLSISLNAYSQPANDNCNNASEVTISGNGYGIGVFTSGNFDISNATVQPGESFAPAILVAGQTQKSIWFKFTIPTTRAVKVTLAQTGTAITAGDVGFAVYKANACLPGNSNISTKLTPIGVFGNTFHPCVDSAVYYVQVSAKNSAAGQVYISVETSFTSAVYDRPAQAYNFGTLAVGVKTITYPIDCQSIEDASENCTILNNYQAYNKSTWHVFTTPNYFDYIVFLLGAQSQVPHKFGFRIYQGDVTSSPYTSLPVLSGCDSLISNPYIAGRKIFRCGELNTNTTYSIQVFALQSYNENVVVALSLAGTAPTKGPEPSLTSIPSPTNALGVLPASVNSVNTSISDYLACNARHSQHSCPASMPTSGVSSPNNSMLYNLSSFFTFSLTSSTELTISGSLNCSPNLFIRLYKQGVTNNCADLNPVNIAGYYSTSANNVIRCLEPGNYTLQVMGTDSMANNNYYYYGSLSTSINPLCILSNLGQKFNLTLTAKTLPNSSKYALQAPGRFDSINVAAGIMQPLANGVTYTSHLDSFACANSVLPWDTTCAPGNTKVIYREFTVSDSTVLYLTNSNYLNWKLYQGDANALANAQNVHAYPQKIQGLNPVTKCLQYSECGGTKVCLQPGTYTHATFASDGYISFTTQPSFTTSALVTTYASPATAENLGDILAQVTPGNYMNSSVDYFSCKDNAVPINGYTPCLANYSNLPATKAIYREFYLSAPASININNYYSGNTCDIYNYYTAKFTVFAGKASNGLSGLTVLSSPWQCTKSVSTVNNCNILQAGWYTIVSYGSGPSYSNPLQNVSSVYNSGEVGVPDRITIAVNTMCPGPKYNRPFKAAVDSTTQQPFLIEWAPRAGHTNAYPKTDTLYTLYKENFNCIVDTPFSLHPLPNCDPSLTKVSYYVFQTTQESYLQVNTQGFMGAIYSGNAKTDSASFVTSTPIQTCLQSTGLIQICRLQPGYYTLVIFANSSQNCTYVQPTIYIDKVGQSRFDHASKAYDFGLIPPDSVYHNGKAGDVNPLDASRAPSNDFFYCTTGAQMNDPDFPPCGVEYKASIYNGGINNPIYTTPSGPGFPRRNLWYTFTVDKGGYVRIKVNNKTIGKNYQYYFSVYKSDANGTIPFSSLVSSGGVDSTLNQGLSFVTRNYVSSYYCYPGPAEISFYIPSCNPVQERYYIIVDNPTTYYGYVPYYYMNPNHQAEVSILMDSVNSIQPQYDHYYQANNIGTNLGAGTYSGATDNFSCATKDLTDPTNNYTSCGLKSLWYKFSTTITGRIRYRVKINNSYQHGSYYDQIQLFKQIIPGDSTSAGLMNMPYTSSAYDNIANTNWYETCINPGTYYIILPGCNRINENVFPEIQIIENKGDFCTAPVIAPLSGPGTNVSSVTVDCHSIGTDYGEFNSTLTCPNGAQRSNYKTSWFKIQITGNDTLDVTTYLTENTNALASEIKYRMMDGNCGAMQEKSCVQDAQTQDTYKCLPPGEYFIQVFTPITKNGTPVTGTINLNLSAVIHADTCAPINNCLATAVFIPQFDCTVNDTARFTNLSTYGSGVIYEWNFGYNNQTSNLVSPGFVYPFLATDQTYTVKLKVTNTGCTQGLDNVDSMSVQLLIPGRPYVNLGTDTTLCATGSTLTVNATSWPGSTYLWSGGITTPTKTLTFQSYYSQEETVIVSYNGCIKRDTIKYALSPFTKISATKYLCTNDSAWMNSDRQVGNAVSYSWNTGSTLPGIYVKTPGLYTQSLTWKNCNYIDSFTVVSAPSPFAQADTTLCYPFQSFTLNAYYNQASTYTWQNGSTGTTFNVTAPGTYAVKFHYINCFQTDTIRVYGSPASVINNTTASICAGQNYSLPWGPVVNSTGIYSDTIQFPSGCDSLIQIVNLNVTATINNDITASICSGQNYTLPWGPIVSTPGIYRDTIKTAAGCDSLVRSVDLSMNTISYTNNSVVICGGQSYTLPWGPAVNTSGTYSDTVQHVLGGCDSLVRNIQVTVNQQTTNVSNATICSGQYYNLPWGPAVNITGTYSDTLFYTSGCDSVINKINLVVNSPIIENISASVCAPLSYSLPWGVNVNTPGTYRDTISYASGCDSLIRIVDLSISQVTQLSTNAVICSGQNYTMPWGLNVNAPGTYTDTIQYLNGNCDSLIRTVNLEVQSLTVNSSNISICQGETFSLPWGNTVSNAGIYKDTIRYASGCDSSITIVNLTVNAPVTLQTAANICAGQSYALPWGISANAAGIYRDTIFFANGCDSLIRIVDLGVNDVTTTFINATICSGQVYTLPSGQAVTMAGIYNDTLHYQAGCDSLVRSVNLQVYDLNYSSLDASICPGQNYTLPWGTVVTTSGIYKDTLYYSNGCDSLVRTVNLSVNEKAFLTISPSICQGESYILPWGTMVNIPGTYRDTLYYTNGCDSVVRTVNLDIKTTVVANANAVICSGQAYTLPWGAIVNSSGTYSDTLHYSTGCDSVVRVVNVTVNQVLINSVNATICSGNSYVLPWGNVVNATGIYRDTSKYTNGCDSLIRQINLVVNATAITNSVTAFICEGENYVLPWGPIVSATGLYIDTARSVNGCDSVINRITLTVNLKPVVSISKSNDINCTLGTAVLRATGGAQYNWSPATSLNNAFASQPVASPTTTTIYTVQVISAQGCITEDSIEVVVLADPMEFGFQMPTAFTPNGDGLNDCIGVKSWGAIKDLKFYIYNRWGQLLFFTTDPTKCWNGTYKGAELGTAVYIYQVSATTICGPVYRKGTVTLIK